MHARLWTMPLAHGAFRGGGGRFERMLWFNPPDNQGIRFLIEHVRARKDLEEGGRHRVKLFAGKN